MKDQKRFLTAIILALAVMIVYSLIFAPQQPQVPQAEREAVEEGEILPLSPERPTKETPETKEGPAGAEEPEEETIIETPLIRTVLSNRGAGIKELYLKGRNVIEEGELYRLLAPADAGQRPLAIEELNNIPLSAAIYERQEVGERRVKYSSIIDDRLQITKTFNFHNSNYIIDLEIEIFNLSGTDRLVGYALIGSSQIDRGGQMDRRFTNSGVFAGGKLTWQRLPGTGKSIRTQEEIDWVVLRNSHYSSILRPFQETSFAFIRGIEDAREAGQNWLTGVRTKEVIVSAGGSIRHNYQFYAGPTTEKELAPAGLEAATNYGKLNFLCQVSIKTLNFLYGVSYNYGLAIILLTILINIFIYPLTLKNVKSMKQMQAIQPHLAKLREKHKDDQRKLQTEMMKLYKDHKANPLGGCLPSLIQMPIFIALYITLARSAELRGSNFLWIKDLSQPDALAKLPFSIPFLGDSLNLLPIIMIVAMVFQQKITVGAKSSSGQDSAASQQQKMMMFMPIFFGFILYNLPSGLVLYWTVNTIIMATMHFLIRNRLSTKEAERELLAEEIAEEII
jgi:YidC/Oxa1 family membrane protein insertase